jgi:hypothetical protein
MGTTTAGHEGTDDDESVAIIQYVQTLYSRLWRGITTSQKFFFSISALPHTGL